MESSNNLISYLFFLISYLIILLFALPFILAIPFRIINHVLRYLFPENVAGKVVLITGASTGIGEQLAYEYAKRGACLAIASRSREKLKQVADKAREFGSPDVIIEVADISKVEDCKRLVSAVVDHFGRLDHLVNNAGILQVSAFEDITDFESVAPMMDVNFWGSVYCTRFAIPYLRKSKGKIAIVSSAASWIPIPRFSLYSASKGAVVSFFETLRTEVGSDIGITICTPGLVDSEMARGQNMKEGKLEFLPKQTVEECAKETLSGICRGDRFLIDQTGFKILYLWKLLVPELLDVYNRWLLITKPECHEDLTKYQ